MLLAAIAAAVLLIPGPVAQAHPLDRLIQHVILSIDGAAIHGSVAIGGGMMANEAVLAELDANGDGSASADEQHAWIARWLGQVRITLDDVPVPLTAGNIRITVPALNDFHVGTQPILLAFDVPLPAAAAAHKVVVRIDYHLDRTDFRLTTNAGNGATISEAGWPSHIMRIAFSADPAAFVPGQSTGSDTEDWSGTGVTERARRIFAHEKTVPFIGLMLLVFAALGALHALQPGHGKTLVAAYLVATGGTPRDALTLAGIVTFTHTISVFLLGMATLAASEFFLPSRVIPVLGVVSGLLVAGMGVTMLWRSLRRRLKSGAILPLDHAHGHPDDGHHHHHDHAHLSDDEHARLHLEEALAARERVSRRSLVTLGISGGIAPCPDALAILLLAIGMGQAAFGMIAIVAFSAGLASVLIAFGLAIALAGPVWSSRRSRLIGESPFGRVAGRLAQASPLISATVVLVLGIAMAWRSMTL